MEYVQKHHLASLYLKLLYMKVIFSLQLIYVLCKFDSPNHLMEFQPKFFRDPINIFSHRKLLFCFSLFGIASLSWNLNIYIVTQCNVKSFSSTVVVLKHLTVLWESEDSNEHS